MNRELIEILCGELEQKLLHQDEVNLSSKATARQIQESISISFLEDCMSTISFEGQNSTSQTHEATLQVYLHLIDKSVSIQNRRNNEDFVKRFMDCVAALSVLSGASVQQELVHRAILYSRAVLERVRKRAVMFMGFLMVHIFEEFGEDLRDLLCIMEEALIVRLKDKCKGVRACAVEASKLFFHTNNNTENLLNTLIWNLWHDPVPANRSIVVRAVPLNESTVWHVIQRVRDFDTNVRLSALQALRANIASVSYMSADAFAEVIRGGFSDRCSEIKEAMLSLVLFNWIEAVDFDLLELLRRIDVLSNEDACSILLSELIAFLKACNGETHDSLKAVKIQALRASFIRQKKSFVESIELKATIAPEEVFLFKLAHCEGATSPNMLPEHDYEICSSLETSKLCDLIVRYSRLLHQAMIQQNYSHQDEYTFCCLQLIDITGFVCIDEEGSKRHFLSFIETIVTSPSTSDELVDRLISTIFRVEIGDDDIVDIASCILRSLSHEAEKGSEERDSWRLARYLNILSRILENASMDAINKDLLLEISVVVTASIAGTNDFVREVAVNCLGKLGFFKPPEKVWKNMKPTLLRVALNEKEKLAIRSQALLSLCDLAILSQEDLHSCQHENGTPSFVYTLTTLLRNRNLSVVSVVGETSMRLLLDGRSNEPMLLASLLITYFDPRENHRDEVDYCESGKVGSTTRLHQLLSIFFPAYAALNREALTKSLHLALECSANKSLTNCSRQTAKFPTLKMLDYVMAILETDSSGSVRFGDVAILVCVQVARFVASNAPVSGAQTKAFCNFILQQVMKIETGSEESVYELNEILEDLQMITEDESVAESLSQAIQKLADLDALTRTNDSSSTNASDCSDSESIETANRILVDSTNTLDCICTNRLELVTKDVSLQSSNQLSAVRL